MELVALLFSAYIMWVLLNVAAIVLDRIIDVLILLIQRVVG